jgi:fibronectin-binding autotransporter adhesin
LEVVVADDYVWLGGSGDFGIAANWDDTTTATDPASTPPGPADEAQFNTGPGTITGSGTVAVLQFLGAMPWVVDDAQLTDTGSFQEQSPLTIQNGATIANTGSSVVIDSGNTTTTAALLVTGTGSNFTVTNNNTWLLVGTSGNASLSVTDGASVTAGFLVSMGGNTGSTIHVDGTSSLEIGTAGSAAAGAVTVDSAANGIDYQLFGYGTIAANLVNNDEIEANPGGAPLEVTGSVTGTGNLNIASGFNNGPGSIVPGGVLRLDGSVASTQTVVFAFTQGDAEAPSLQLADPTDFAGTLSNFSGVGDTLDLIGETLTGASVTGSVLTVTLASGGPLTFNLGFGAPTTGELLISGSEIRILPTREFDWTGAGGNTAFGNANNWNDTTDQLNPATSPPGATDFASISNAGSITGTGTVYQLGFAGTNTVTGALTATDSLTETSGSLAVTGALNAVSASITGTLSAKSGGRATVGTSLTLAPEALIAVDAASFLEIGSAGTAVAGDITVDNMGSVIGDGTLAAATVVNNGEISANFAIAGSNVLEITGAVTGTGGFDLQGGFNNGSGTIFSGGVLQFDSSVASSQQVTFDFSADPGVSGTLALADPSAFAATIENFQYPGATLDLVGETVTGATVNGSTLTVSLASGGPLTFNLGGGLPSSSQLLTTGSEVRVLPTRLFDWTGASDGNFGNALNWDDTTDQLNPAAAPPSATDIAAIVGAGTIGGTGTVYQLSFDGTNTVAGALTAINSLTERSGSLVVTGSLTAATATILAPLSAQSGGRIVSDGLVTLLSGVAITVDGSSSMEIGTAGTGAIGQLTVDAMTGPSIIASGTLAEPVANNGEIDASGVLEITGAITGDGVLIADHGFHSGTVLVPGGFLQLASSVASSESVQFGGDNVPSEAPTIQLMQPLTFAGTLTNFNVAGDTLALAGDTATGVSVNGTIMTVTLSAGGPLTFTLGGGLPTTDELLAIGSDVRVVPIRELDWTGADGQAFGDANNWNDITDAQNPAATPPGESDLASLTNAGAVTGNAAVYQLEFGGTDTATGTLTAHNSLTMNAGSLVVTGSLSAASETLSGTVSALSGGRVTTSGAVQLLPGGALAVDSGSAMEVGTAGDATTGSLIVDTGSAGINGDGTIAASVINDGAITAVTHPAGSNELEMTGAVSGAGTFNIQNGFGSGPGAVPGAVLRFDGAVGNAQHVVFGSTGNSAEEPELVLADPGAFAGIVDNFNTPGDTISLPGQTVTGASVSGSTLTVTLSAGGPVFINLGFSAPTTSQLLGSGSDIRVVPLRQLTWTGASDSDFGNALNWNDTSDNLNPAASPPGPDDFASLSNAGSITGDATVYQLSFGGTNTVTDTLAAVSSLTETSGSLVVTGSLSAASLTLSGALSASTGGQIVSSGQVQISPSTTIAVDGASTMEIGTAGTGVAGSLTVDATGGAGLIGDGTLAAAVVNNGQIDANSGNTGSNLLEIIGALSGTGGIALGAGSSPSVPGAELRLDSTVTGSQTIFFGDAADPAEAPTLILADPTAATETLSGFTSPGDTLDLVGEMVTGASIVGSTMTVTLASGGPLNFALSNTPSSTNLTFSGEDVSVATLCFLAGTMIATPSGERRVEQLAAGDMVLTSQGHTRPISWAGAGRVLATRGRRTAATPVIVRRGALAPNVPHHDLRVTKGHSFYLDGVLIPVEFLVNHRSIVWDDRAQEVSVHHIELETHDVLVANGAAAESYRDDGNRWLFQNANTGWDQPPKPPCAPVLMGGRVVDAIWRRLLDRSGPRPALPLTGDADLHLMVGGVRVDYSAINGQDYIFDLRNRPGPVSIVSRDAVPAELGATRDARSLGVAVRRIAVRGGARVRVIEADDESLTDGFHDYEPEEGIRWTKGAAVLPPCLFDGLNGRQDLILGIGGTTRYVAEADGRAVA